MAFAEDLDLFLDTEEGVAVQATFGAGSTAKGVFKNESDETLGVQGRRVTFLCKEAAVAALAVNAQITIESQAYYCRRKLPDGTGLTELILEAVQP